MKTYDAIIIGSGQGGTPLAKKLAKAGWKTALIEKQYIGGTCVNVGCTPTKTMIASAKTIYTITQAHTLGVEAELKSVDIATILKRKSDVVDLFRDGSQKGVEETENLELLWGKAAFTGKNELQVMLNSGGSEIISAPRIIISAGAHAAIPKIPGIEDSGYLTSASLMELTEIPKHLLIIGAGYIALEFGQMYRRFGSQVTIVEQGERILVKEDEDVSHTVLEFLQQEGIRVICKSGVTKIDNQEDYLLVSLKDGQELPVSHLLVAAGRTPNTSDLNLEKAGVIVTKKGHIQVNEFLETSAEGIYAIGDIKGGPQFTHIAYNDYIILAQNLLANKQITTDRIVPYCMFTDPQLGRVGITETEAQNKGLNIKVACLPMSKVARAIEVGDQRGFMKAVVDADSGQILGAAIIAEDGGEIMSVLQMAMLGRIPHQQIRKMIFAHPLYSESLNNLFLTLEK
ncbi:PF00070 family, FAD-dependent NAD(P)-disulfide oxidoreductase [Arcticibacter svalbardensis MN12-7]|uniref:PF00070 family, FAD-dependent NAD(P)-disulfide oxidoreductase n=1 Tax=Arcticibacter svalbardensis MN12-7 TaxID=1150600 RepID=R9GWJ6_9SPHI|nr:mercuric reductase [Arcticibacter svalbardensis]EOR93319.1 PF00070 family, FAD-dependent NAD(P)-disulfide oxidoreductase [Arcticibacter svalbardensis MN12-7]